MINTIGFQQRLYTTFVLTVLFTVLASILGMIFQVYHVIIYVLVFVSFLAFFFLSQFKILQNKLIADFFHVVIISFIVSALIEAISLEIKFRGPIQIISLIMLGSLVYYFRNILTILIEKVNIKWLICILTLYITYMADTSNVFNFHHHVAHAHSVMLLSQGIPYSQDVVSTYGHYALFLAPFYNLMGSTLHAYNTILALLCGISFLNFSLVLNKLVTKTLYKVLGLFSLVFVFLVLVAYPKHLLWSAGLYYATIPLRIFFPSLLMLCVAYWRSYNFVGYLISMLAIISNPETGLVCLITWTTFDFYQKSYTKNLIFLVLRAILYFVGSFLGAWFIFNAFNMMLGGDTQNITYFLFPILSKFPYSFRATWFNLMPWLGITILFISLAYSLFYLNVFRLKEKLTYNHEKGLIFVLSLYGLLAITYYINRKAPGNSLIAGCNIIILIVWISSKVSTIQNTVLMRWYTRIGLAILIILSSLNVINLLSNSTMHTYLKTKYQAYGLVSYIKFIKRNVTKSQKVAAFGNDSITYALSTLGMKNSLPITDSTTYGWGIPVERPLEILIENAPQHLFISEKNRSAVSAAYNILYDKEKLNQFLTEYYILIDQDPINDIYYYQKKRK